MDDRNHAQTVLSVIDVAQRDSDKMTIAPCHHRSESGSTDEVDITIRLVRRETDRIRDTGNIVPAKQAVLISDETATREKAAQVGVQAFTAHALVKFLASAKRRRSSVLDAQPALHTLTVA